MWSRIACVIGILGAIALLETTTPVTGVSGVAPSPDVNGDGSVNAIDLALVGQCVGQSPQQIECAAADVDHDGDVDLADVQLVATFMRTRRPTATRTGTATRVAATATATATGTAVSVPTSTPALGATATSTPSSTPVPSATATATPPNTATATGTATPSPSASPTQTGTPTASVTATATTTPTTTATSTATNTATVTASATATTSQTPTRTPTLTATATHTGTRTPTPTNTATATPTHTPTFTHTRTMTPTQTPVDTATDTPTIPATPVDTSTGTPSATPGDGLPPDPIDVAPPLEQGVATKMLAATDFLYTGPNPIQTGVAPGTIVAERAAVLRGVVTDRDNMPLAGVRITILDHSELGQTLTRDDGMFDLAVNGGSTLTVDYAKEGFLSAQRKVEVPWEDYVVLPDVVLVALDPVMTSVDLTAAVPVQVARGSMVSDAAGTRQATLLFPQGTTATMVFPDGTTQPITQLSVRATEYTVGPNGPNAMPAELPPTSAYTYCAELSVDEALTAGASQVRFGAPVPFYVENFLGFPIGLAVPFGMYDRERGAWESQPSGRVIKILSFTGGLANLDVDGNGVADTGAALTALSITDAERQQLATLYLAGQSLWRVLVSHFTPGDLNWPPVPPADAIAPDQDPELDESLDGVCQTPGSIIECENQLLGEAIGVAGTNQRLHYQSDRVPGHRTAYTVEIPLTGPVIPASLRAVEWRVIVAGRLFGSGSIPADENLRSSFTWDGKDAYGRTVSGAQRALVGIYYEYGAVYGPAASFSSPASQGATAVVSRTVVKLFRTWVTQLGTWHAQPSGLGGWTLSEHHAYDPIAKVLYRGDGLRESTRSVGPSIATVAGNGAQCTVAPCGDGGPATAAQFSAPTTLAVAPDGVLYIVDQTRRVVRRVGRDGIITTVAGNGLLCESGPCGDGGPATQAALDPRAIAICPDNSLYIVERGFSGRVRKVDPDGIIAAFAGSGANDTSGDGGPALLAGLTNLRGIACGPDGSVYVGQTAFNSSRVRRIGPDGIITLYAGGGINQTAGSSLPAIGALMGPGALAVGPDGSLYIADDTTNRVRRVTPDGILRNIAGLGVLNQGFSGDGGPATQARISRPGAIAVGPDGSVYFTDVSNNRIRWLRPDGIIDTLAGTGAAVTLGDGGLAAQASLQGLSGIALGPDGSIYFGQQFTNLRVRRIAPLGDKALASGLIVPSTDGKEVYTFTTTGRHLETLDALTGTVRYRFAYDAAGRLESITDADGNVTTVEHDGQGRPTAIVGPFSHRTLLGVDVNRYLSSITQPGGEMVQLDYTDNGLLTTFTMPGGQDASYAYDGRGRLISATDESGATKTLTRTGTNRDHTITLTTHLGRVSRFRVEHIGINLQDTRLTTTDPSGAQAQITVRRNGQVTGTDADGTSTAYVFGPDPRWGMRAPIATSATVTTPGGLVHTSSTQRTATLAAPNNLLNLTAHTETTSINGRVSTSTFDAATQAFTVTSPAGRRITTVVDNLDRPVQTQFADLQPISSTYDDRGRVETVTQGPVGANRVALFDYGSDGQLASVTDPVARTTLLMFDANGRLSDLTQADGGQVNFAYDVNGNISSIVPPDQAAHGFAYSERDEVEVYTPPRVGVADDPVHYDYDEDRQPLRFDQPHGQTVQFNYDAAGRLDELDLGTAQRTVAYDAAGRLMTVATSEGVSTTYGYDGPLLKTATSTGPVPGSIGWTYDTSFRVTSLTFNGIDPVGIVYDGDSLPTQVGSLTLTRNPQKGFVTATTLGSVTDAIGYDSFGAPISYVASHAGSPVLSMTFTRHPSGRITNRSETISGVTRVFDYDYDPVGRLAEVREDGVVTASYTYDRNGNRLTRTTPNGTSNATYDAQDRLVQDGTITYGHNENGERETKTAGGETTTYQYDGLRNLIGVMLPDGTQVEYLVDGEDSRVGRKVDGVLVQGFLYQSDLQPIAELDGSGNVVSRFVYGSNSNVPHYMIKAGQTYRIVADHLGSPRMVIAVATGQVVQRIDYDELGMIVLDTNPGFQPFGFAGGIADPHTGLVHFGARDYDPETGRWTAKDSLGFGGGDANLYAYASNNPVNNVDPTGLICTDTLQCTCMRQPKLCAALAGGAAALPKVRDHFQRVIQVAQRAPKSVNVVQRASCQASSAPTTSSVVQGGIVNADKVNTLARAGQYVDDFADEAPTLVRNAQNLVNNNPYIRSQPSVPYHLQPQAPQMTWGQMMDYIRNVGAEGVQALKHQQPGTKSRAFGKSNLRHK